MDIGIEDTIAALASPPGSAARGIVRVSGNRVRDALAGWFEPKDATLWYSAKLPMIHPGKVPLSSLDVNRPPVLLPVDLHFWPNHRSYTGQPLAEFHLVGSPPLLEALLTELHRRGARPAKPGEFTLRAFLAGKLDLLQAEAVLGVIDAHDHRELQTALEQLAGGVSGRLAELRSDLLELLADLEAGLDFVEEDIEFVSRRDVVSRLTEAHEFVKRLLEQSSSRMQSSARPRVVLAGLPNAGKSTLFNRLTGRNTAIVSAQQGTTRDFLTATVDLGGMTIDLVDTAGWEERADGIGAAAQDQRSDQLHRADLVIWCSLPESLAADQAPFDNELANQVAAESRSFLRVTTQTDLMGGSQRPSVEGSSFPTTTAMISRAIAVSAQTGEGIVAFLALIRERLAAPHRTERMWLGSTASRCRESLECVGHSLERALSGAAVPSVGDELIAVDLRDSLDHLGRILGVVYTDDILDRVFSKFCIGK